MLKSLALPTLAFLALAQAAPAQLIVGNDQSGIATIYNIDVMTGVATPIYSASTTDAKPWGMAYDSSTNTLYWNNGSTLFSSPLGPTLTPTNLGGMTFNAATVNFVALGFHNGKLYGTRNVATEAVYEIDPVTLVATQSFVHPTTFDFGGLDWDASSGILYGLNDATGAPGGRGLFSIDLVAMTTTVLAPYPAGETDIDALAVGNGLAYFVSDGPNTTQASFYVVDVATGMQVGTLPSPFTGSGTFSGATFADAPSTPSPTPYCFGDGTGTPCPCSPGAPGNGCSNGSSMAGANLAAAGTASVGTDTLVLSASGMPPTATCRLFQGTSQVNGGLGMVFGDGLNCVGGTLIRFGVKTSVGGAATYPGAGDPALSVTGMVAPGDVRNYQVIYRDASAFCTADTFNLTNAINVVWAP
jgi:hypothetical protein